MIRKTRISMCYSIVLILAVMVGLSLFITSCGEKKPPEKLTIKIIDSENELTPDIYVQIVSDFAKTHPKLIVNCTPTIVLSDISANELVAKFIGTDVVIFPSLFNHELRSLPNAFYPIQPDNTEIPPVIDRAYAAEESGKSWAIPLIMDPMVMVLKQTFNPPDLSWLMLEIYGNLYRNTHGNGTPPMCILNGRPSDLADSVTSRILAMGFERYTLHHVPLEVDRTEEDFLLSVGNGFLNWRRFLDATPKQYTTPADRISELPLVSDIKAFIDSDAAMTFVRYSDFAGLSPELKQKIRVIQIPTPYEPSILAHVVSAGIPIDSENPTRGDEFIRFLLSQKNKLCDNSGFIPVEKTTVSSELNRIISPQTVIIPREKSTTLGQKMVIDALNGTMNFEEFNAIWTSSIFVPSH